MAEAGDEWAAVMFFYAAYHRVRAALLEDPTFDSVAGCAARHVDLRPEDRHATRHHGRRSRNQFFEFGVNEIVQILYPSAIGAYDQLHQMSIQVRYERGLVPDLRAVVETWERFRKLDEDGALTGRP